MAEDKKQDGTQRREDDRSRWFLVVPVCCGTCRDRDAGTGCCASPESAYKNQYMAPREACGHWKERRKPNA